MRRRNLILVLAALLLAVGVSLFIRQANQWGRPTVDRVTSTTSTSGGTNAIVSAAGAPALLTGQSAAPADPLKHQFRNTTNNIETLLADNRAILLENALIDTTRPLDFSIPEHLRAAAEPGTYMVQARGFITDRFRAVLTAAGATVLSYIPNNAYQVVASAAVAEQLARHPDVQAVLPFEPIYKLKSELLGWAVEQKALPEGAKLNLLLTPALQATARDGLTQAGATIVREANSPFGPVVTVLPDTDWSRLARLPGVQGVELAHSRIHANDRSRERLGVATNSVAQTNYLGLTGTNVLVGLNDTGVSSDHPDLVNRIFPWTPLAGIDNNGHGTHVAGIIAGDGTQSLTVTNARGSINPGTNIQYRGQAPGAKLFVQSLDLDGTGVTDEALQIIGARTNAFISNNSWHYAGDNAYDIAASSYDAAVRDALPGVPGSQPQLYVFAAGNIGNGGDDGKGGFARTIMSPGTAKNVITVGALEQARDITNIVTVITGDITNTTTPWAGETSSDQEVAGFSSRGNVAVGLEGTYGRFKPDVVAPGTFVVSTRSTTWDEQAYYNPTSHIFTTLSLVADTNGFALADLSLPPNAVGFNVWIIPNNNSPIPFPDLPIYVRKADFPTATTYDFIRTNSVSVPPDAAGVVGDESWFFGVRNITTTQPLHFTLITDMVVTNKNGDELIVKSNLNNSIAGTPTSGTPPHYYRYESGTSMAAAAVSGTLALMQEFFERRLFITNSPAMMKALLINGSRSVNSSAYNFLVKRVDANPQGWGLPQLPNSAPSILTNGLNTASNSIFMFDQSPTNALATSQSKTRTFKVSDEGRTLPLRVTLVWTDPPGNPVAGVKLVNDLDLVVTNLDTMRVYYGNNFPSVGEFSVSTASNGAPAIDLVNNVENVYINADLGTNYAVAVIARRVNVNAVTAHTNGVVQDYALVISSGEGEAPDALYLDLNPPIAGLNTNLAAVTVITNIFVGDGFSSAGLEGQRVGANSPLMGTTTGTTNQWHFYIITNKTEYTNASFLTSAATDLSIPRAGVFEPSVLDATRAYADVDLYVSPNNGDLISLDPAAVTASDKSLSRNTFNGDEAVIYSNSVAGDVYYIGVKSEDSQAAEFELWAIFSLLPLGQEDANGFVRVYPFNPADSTIPSGSNESPGVAKWRAYVTGGGDVRRVVITNALSHQLLDDMIVSVVSPSGLPVALINHDKSQDSLPSEEPVPYRFLYEDNDEGDLLDAIHPEGPGHLYDYVGEKRDGQWKFFFVDDFGSNTGRVDAVRIKVEKQCEDDCNMTNVVQAQSWRYFAKNVPVEATNMTVCLQIITPTGPLPLELYIRKDAFPTHTAYDFKKTINPPGDCLSIDKFQLPPLSPGRYFIGVYNPSASSQTFFINITVETGPAPTPITFNPAGTQPLLDDAVTNFTTTVTDHMQIARLDVGLRIDHPRVSDLAVTLISPGGTRVLLVENRGGTTTNGFGSSLPVVTNFFPVSAAGGPAATNIFIDTGATAGTVTIDYNFQNIPDQMRVYYESNLLADTGMVNGTGRLRLNYGPGASTFIEVRMNEGDNTNSTTAWSFVVASYSTANSYLVFTDNTNLTTTPVKFALPPYVGTGGTNYLLSDFELPTVAQDYIGPTVGTPDGWSVINSNTVTVITNTAYNGTNSLSLRSGEISRTITNTPGRSYRLGYGYRQDLFSPPLINVDFGGGPINGLSLKVGTAATGATPTDFWNYYSRGDVVYRDNGALTDLIRADGTISSVGLTVIDAAGAWGNGSLDRMYDGYVYPLPNGPNPVTLTITNLPAARYNIYLYSHNGNYQLISGAIDYGIKTTRDLNAAGVTPTWQQGTNFALFSNVLVAGPLQPITIVARPGVGDVAMICGLQIQQASAPTFSGAQVFVPGVATNVFLGSTNWQAGGLTFTATGTNTTINVSPVSTNLPSGVLVDYFTITETVSPRYVLPEESLTAFEGEYADGEWRLEILDTRTGATNNVTLLDWQLQFIYQTNTAPPRVLNPGDPVDVTLPPGRLIYFVVDVPSFARFATNVLYNATAPVGFYFNQDRPPGYGATNVGDYALTTGAQNFTAVLSSNTVPQLVSGQRYYLAVENSGTSNVTFTVYVDFDLRALPPLVDLINGVPYCTVNTTPFSLDYYHFIVSSNAVRAQFALSQLDGDMTMILRRGLPPSFNSFDYLSASVSTNDEIITVFDFSQPVSLAPGDWYFAAANLAPGAVSYCATAWEWTAYGTNIVITNTFLGTNSFCLSWTSLPGVRYVVEGVTNLSSTNWVAVSPTVVGAGSVTTYCVPLPSPYQFFRVREGQTQSTFVPPPYIIRIIKRFNGIEIDWSGPPGQQYNVEWSPTLTPIIPWVQFAETITSTTGIYGYLDDGSQTGGLGGTRYYRLVLLP